MDKAELLFAELFHSLFSFDDELNIVQSVIIYFMFMSISMMSMGGPGGPVPTTLGF